MTDTLQNVAILMLCIAVIVHALGGDHGEHWFALDTLARMYEGLERRVKEDEKHVAVRLDNQSRRIAEVERNAEGSDA